MRWEWAFWLLLSGMTVALIIVAAWAMTCSQDPLGYTYQICRI